MNGRIIDMTLEIDTIKSKIKGIFKILSYLDMELQSVRVELKETRELISLLMSLQEKVNK